MTSPAVARLHAALEPALAVYSAGLRAAVNAHGHKISPAGPACACGWPGPDRFATRRGVGLHIAAAYRRDTKRLDAEYDAAAARVLDELHRPLS